MIGALLRLPVPLQAVVQVTQHLRDHLVTDRMALGRQSRREDPRALRRPPKWRLRIPARERFDEGIQSVWQFGIDHLEQRPPRAWAPDATDRQRHVVEFLQAFRDGHPRQPTRATDEGDAAMAKLPRFAGRKQPSRPLVQMRPQARHFLSQGVEVGHALTVNLAPRFVSFIY